MFKLLILYKSMNIFIFYFQIYMYVYTYYISTSLNNRDNHSLLSYEIIYRKLIKLGQQLLVYLFEQLNQFYHLTQCKY